MKIVISGDLLFSGNLQSVYWQLYKDVYGGWEDNHERLSV